MTPTIVNIAAYQFCTLGDLVALRTDLKQRCGDLALKGTILLSAEGINFSLAGPRAAVDALLTFVRTLPGCAAIQHKESLSDYQPFNRMLVKLKKEIIAFGQPGIAPEKYTSRKITAEQLKQWLDAGQEVVLLDTRNAFEAEVGTFANAVTLPLTDFRDFPQKLAALPGDLKHRPVVTFCTGGIRCEKAAPYLEQAGFTDVYQLDGGILKYFEHCGAAHYHGACYVFDQRRALDAELRPVADAGEVDACDPFAIQRAQSASASSS